QVDNMALVLAGVDLLRRQGFKLLERDVQDGIALTRWPGRFDIVRAAGRPALIFDGAHSPPAVGRLLSTLSGPPWKDRAKTLVFGVYRDKDSASMLKAIRSHADQMIFCT